VSVNFLGNPKFQILKAELGNVPDYVVMGVMECIWERCHQNKNIKRDGVLPAGWGPAHIAALAGWDKGVDVLEAALASPAVNLVEHLPGGVYRIHDYSDHVPEYVRKRWSREEPKADAARTPSDDVRTPSDDGESRDDHHAMPCQDKKNMSMDALVEGMGLAPGETAKQDLASAKTKTVAVVLRMLPDEYKAAPTQRAYLQKAIEGVIDDAWQAGGRPQALKRCEALLKYLKEAIGKDKANVFGWAKTKLNRQIKGGQL
jgi:hypothetical protein